MGQPTLNENDLTTLLATFGQEEGMMLLETEWVADIADMHDQFGVNAVVRNLPPEKLRKFLEFRLDFLQEELNEARKAFDSRDKNQAEDIVDAMIDLCVVAIGTLNAFDVDADEAWARVFEKNMQKTPGIKPERPNPLGLPDLIKPAGWTAPTHADNVGMLPDAM